MATRIGRAETLHGDNRFFFTMAVVMALVLVAGFSLQLVMGRSTFQSPLLVHVHAVVFFGWTIFYVLQSGLIAGGSVTLHRRLGWAGGIWAALMVVVGITTTAVMVRQGTVPFFFLPLRFLMMNSLFVLTFAGLTAAAIMMRRRTDWHRRLMYCGMAILTGPGFGRLLPMPFMIPWADFGVYVAVMIFPIVGMIADWRRTGRVHPAWLVGAGAISLCQNLIGVAAGSPLGASLYQSVTAGAPGETVAPLAYPPMPPL